VDLEIANVSARQAAWKRWTETDGALEQKSCFLRISRRLSRALFDLCLGTPACSKLCRTYSVRQFKLFLVAYFSLNNLFFIFGLLLSSSAACGRWCPRRVWNTLDEHRLRDVITCLCLCSTSNDNSQPSTSRARHVHAYTREPANAAC